MKSKANRFLATSLAAVAALSSSAWAVDRIKQNNTTDLNLAGSWDTLPTSSDVAVWNSTVTAANAVNLGGNLSWAGIRIANPGGLITIRHAAGQTLTLGASGIDMSAATQNLTLMTAATANTAGTLAISASQTWNIASGRALTLFSTSNSANQRLSGSGNIGVTGGGLVNLNVGDAGSATFAAGNGNDTYTGNWTITGGSKVISLRNGTHAWGQGTITLDNGTMSQSQGNWSFSNNITIGTGGGTIFSDSTGNSRYMNLTGVISGNGALNFNAVAAMSGQEGFILTGNNTFTGPMTINANATVRVGGDATTTTNSTSAGTLGSLAASVAITNNGILGFGRTDAHTFANDISGSGIVRLGRVSGALPATQVVTMSGTNTYVGATQVNAGRLNLTGSLTSAITVASGASVSGNGSTTGLLTLNSGGGLVLAGGGTTSSLTTNGATFGGSNLVNFLSNPIASNVYDVFTYGAGTVTNPGNLSVAWRGTLANDAPNQKYVFTAGASGTRTWNTASGTWAQGVAGNWIEDDQTFYGGDTVFFNEPGSASNVTLSGRLAPASVLVTNTTNAYTFSGTDGTADITGASTLTKTGSGTLILNSAHTYTGATTVSSGVLEVGTGGTSGALGSGAVSVAAGAEIVFNRSNAFTVSNTISGDGLVTKRGGGRMTVNGNSSAGTVNWNFTGTGNGDIGFQNANALGASGSTLTLAVGATGSAFFGTSGNTTDVAISLGSGSVFTWNGSTGNTTTLSGEISGAGAITKVSGEILRLTGVNTYTGATTISTGFVEISGAGQLGSGNYAGNISNAATFTVNSNANQILSGVVSGAGVLNKSNDGALTLLETNTYTGATNVTGGALVIGASGSLANTTTTIGVNGSLAGGGSIGGATTIQGTHSPGFSPGTQTFTNGLSYADTATLNWELTDNTTGGRGTNYDAVNVSGSSFALASGATIDLSFGGTVDFLSAFWGTNQEWLMVDLSGSATAADSNLFTIGSITGGANYSPSLGSFGILRNDGSTTADSVYLTWTPIPEPEAALLGGIGMLLLLRRRR
jgi:fibronectin-binding autotransporter adhesin